MNAEIGQGSNKRRSETAYEDEDKYPGIIVKETFWDEDPCRYPEKDSTEDNGDINSYKRFYFSKSFF